MIDKMKNLVNSYEELSESKRANFSRIVNRLFAINYICGGRKRDRDDFYFISANETLIKDYLFLIDYDLYVNNADMVAYINNRNNYNHLNINLLYSIVLLLLRKLYFQKSQELQDNDFISITLKELHLEIETTGLYPKRITITELREIYSFLSKYNICEKIGDLNDDDARLLIYPTINYILPVSKIDELAKRISSYKRGDLGEDIN